jgi:hypothetical protein
MRLIVDNCVIHGPKVQLQVSVRVPSLALRRRGEVTGCQMLREDVSDVREGEPLP